MTLTIVPATGEALEQWRTVHNLVIPPIQLTAADVAERATRNDLTVAYVDGALVGNATVRPVQDGLVTVIVRILPEYRRHGLGREYLQALLAQTHPGPGERIGTVVLAANLDGLSFAVRHGFVETERYDVDGVTFIDLTLPDPAAQAPAESRR